MARNYSGDGEPHVLTDFQIREVESLNERFFTILFDQNIFYEIINETREIT